MNDHPTETSHDTDNGEPKWWLDDPTNVTRICYALFGVCVLVLIAGLFVHRHYHFEIERTFGFHAWFGFIVFTLIVLTGKPLRFIVMRDEDYYDR